MYNLQSMRVFKLKNSRTIHIWGLGVALSNEAEVSESIKAPDRAFLI